MDGAKSGGRTSRKKHTWPKIKANLQVDPTYLSFTLEQNRMKDSVRVPVPSQFGKAGSDRELGLTIEQNRRLISEYTVLLRNKVAFESPRSAESIAKISDAQIRAGLSASYMDQDLTEATQERGKQLTRQFVNIGTPNLMNQEVYDQYQGAKENHGSAARWSKSCTGPVPRFWRYAEHLPKTAIAQ